MPQCPSVPVLHCPSVPVSQFPSVLVFWSPNFIIWWNIDWDIYKMIRWCNCQTPVLGLGLEVNFTFTWDNKNNNNHNNNDTALRTKSCFCLFLNQAPEHSCAPKSGHEHCYALRHSRVCCHGATSVLVSVPSVPSLFLYLIISIVIRLFQLPGELEIQFHIYQDLLIQNWLYNFINSFCD